MPTPMEKRRAALGRPRSRNTFVGIQSAILFVILVMVLGFDVCHALQYTCARIDPDHSNCKCQFNDTSKTVIDFSPIAKDGEPFFPFASYGDTSTDFLYAFNPCLAFSTGNCKDVSVCQQNSKDTSQSFPLGDVKPTAWSTPADDSILVTYQSTYQKTTRNSQVTFKCDKAATKSPTLINHGEAPVNTYKFTVTTCLACREHVPGCPYPGQPKLTTGSILCIVFVVLVVVYIITGVLFNKFARGATGVEVIPNYEFWVDFPVLVKDGFLFSISSCRKDEYSQL